MRGAACGVRSVSVGFVRHDAGFRLRTPHPALRTVLLLSLSAAPALAQSPRPRAREIGIVVGSLPPGPLNAITDVAGVRVGHTTIARGDSINTGITAILPHGGNPFRDKVPAAIVVGKRGVRNAPTEVNEQQFRFEPAPKAPAQCKYTPKGDAKVSRGVPDRVKGHLNGVLRIGSGFGGRHEYTPAGSKRSG